MSDNELMGLGEELKGEIRKKLIGGVAAAFVAGLTAALLAIWAYLQMFVGNIGLVQRNSIVAFDGECPSKGWAPYDLAKGKFIVGAGENGVLNPKKMGKNDKPALQLSSYLRGDQGGEEAHSLTEIETSKHKHQIATYNIGFANIGNGQPQRIIVDDGPSFKDINVIGETTFYGGMSDGSTSPHNTLPPYIALTWCIKT
jgi:microcystin-dependent protein